MREVTHKVHHSLVCLKVFWRKAGDGAAKIICRKARLCPEAACQHALAQRGKGHKAYAKLFEKRKHLFFRLAVPHGVLALHCRKRANCVSPAHCPNPRLGKSPVQHLALLCERGYAIRHFLYGGVRIHSVLVVEIYVVGTKALE